jgi:hypothetical protein
VVYKLKRGGFWFGAAVASFERGAVVVGAAVAAGLEVRGLARITFFVDLIVLGKRTTHTLWLKLCARITDSIRTSYFT